MEVTKTTTVKAIKLGENYALSVLAAPFGGPQDRDSDGEYFSQRTKFHLDRFTPSPIYYHGYTKSKAPSPEPVYLGRTVAHDADRDGVWLTVELDAEVPESMEVWNAAHANKAAASSGSIAHLVRKTRDGEILQWPMAEISLWELSPSRPQANKRAIALPALKAAGINIPDELVTICESEDQTGDEAGQPHGHDGDSSSNIFSNDVKESTIMSDEVKPTESVSAGDMMKMVSDQVKAALKADAEARKAKQEEEAARQAELKAALEAQAAELKATFDAELEKANQAAAEARRIPFGEAPYQSKFANLQRFDNLSPDDLAFAYGVLDANRRKGGAAPSEDLAKAIAVGFSESENPMHNAAKGAMKMAGMPLKANELNQSTLASFGDEWVGDAWSSQVWEKVRLHTPIVGMLPAREIPQGYESVTIPIESTSPTFYKVAQASAQDANPGRITQTFTSSKLGTGQKSLTATKMGAFVPWAEEMREDSVVNWANELRRILIAEQAEVMEHVVIDGDTATGATTNINHIGGTPGATDVYLLFDGLRKLATVTNTANSRDGGAIALADFISTVQLLGTAGINGWDRSQVCFTCDMNTMYKILDLTEMKNRDNVTRTTVEGWQATDVFGYNLFPSANMFRASAARLANAVGKVDQTTTANNTTGGLLAFRKDQWLFGYKRRVTFEVQRDPGSDANEIYMHSRVGLVYRDTEASALSYNLTV